MALQHVLDTARKLGIPVVITDEAGEAAQVVMPFDDFAAMVGSSVPTGRASAPANRPRVRPPMPERDEIADALADLRFEEIKEEVAPPPPPVETPRDLDGEDEGFLEDKFYLEPLEDEDPLK